MCQLLPWAFLPFDTCGNRGPVHPGAASARHLPSAGFGHPLDGLLPRSPCRPCFRSAASIGFTLRSVDPRGKSTCVTRTPCPACRLSPDVGGQPKAGHRDNRQSGFRVRLQRIPHGPSECLIRTSGGCSHGFFPLKGSIVDLEQAPLARLLPRAWRSSAVARRYPPSPRSLDRSTTRLTNEGQTPFSGFPRLLHPWHSNARLLRVMGSPSGSDVRYRAPTPAL